MKKLQISGHHVELTAPLKEMVQEKLKRVERHFEHLTSGNIVLSVEKLRHKAEATVHLINGGHVFAEAVHSDMYGAIELLTDKLDSQIRKFKEKLKDHHHSEGLHSVVHRAAYN